MIVSRARITPEGIERLDYKCPPGYPEGIIYVIEFRYGGTWKNGILYDARVMAGHVFLPDGQRIGGFFSDYNLEPDATDDTPRQMQELIALYPLTPFVNEPDWV